MPFNLEGIQKSTWLGAICGVFSRRTPNLHTDVRIVKLCIVMGVSRRLTQHDH
jgi:hypothetical protein